MGVFKDESMISPIHPSNLSDSLIIYLIHSPKKATSFHQLTQQGPREGWAEGALAPHFLVPVKNNNDKVGKSISQRLVSGLTSTGMRNALQEFKLACYHLASD